MAFITKSIYMIEPLLLKSVSSQHGDAVKKNYVFSVSELIQKFQIKSPARNNQSLTDRACSTTKHSNAVANERLVNLAMPKKNSEQTRSSVLREIKIGTPRNNEPRREMQNKKTPTLTRSSQSCKENQFNIVKKNSKKQDGQKEKPIPMFKLPFSNIRKTEDLSLINKAQLYVNIHRQSKKKQQNAASMKRQRIPESTRAMNDEKFFRKSTNASTVSVKSKHTISMHLQEDSDILFSKYIASSQIVPSVKKSGEDMICKLQEAKQKIYQHIYSLDKKLLDQFDVGEGKKALVICLKKRSQKQAEKM